MSIQFLLYFFNGGEHAMVRFTNSYELNHEANQCCTQHGGDSTGTERGKPVIVFTGADQWLLKLSPQTQQHTSKVVRVVNYKKLIEACERVSVYQPILIVLCDDLPVAVPKLLNHLDFHLFFRVFRITKNGKALKYDSHSSLLRNPCAPVITFDANGNDDDRLGREVAQFFADSTVFSQTTSLLPRLNALNEREQRVARYVSQGVPNKVICKRLDVSVKTIEKCRKQLYQKLGVSTSAEVAALMTFKTYFRWPKSIAFPVN